MLSKLARGKGIGGDRFRLPSFTRHLLMGPQDDRGAVCLDGTSGGFYYAPPSDGGASETWVVQLEGGGISQLTQHFSSPCSAL